MEWYILVFVVGIVAGFILAGRTINGKWFVFKKEN